MLAKGKCSLSVLLRENLYMQPLGKSYTLKIYTLYGTANDCILLLYNNYLCYSINVFFMEHAHTTEQRYKPRLCVQAI